MLIMRKYTKSYYLERLIVSKFKTLNTYIKRILSKLREKDTENSPAGRTPGLGIEANMSGVDRG